MSRDVVITMWLVLFGLAVLVEVLGRISTKVDALGEVTGRLIARRSGAVVLLLCWAWLGWHLFAR
ncbi:MAG: DUF6186 family protein [Acidimicrobiales bacterium]